MATFIIRNNTNGKTLCKVAGKNTDLVENLTANVTSENIAEWSSNPLATSALADYCTLNSLDTADYTVIDATPGV